MPSEVTPTSSRKDEHLRINLDEEVQSSRQTGLDDVHLPHEALPDLSLSELDTRVQFLGKELKVPILISSMTGGTKQARRINEHLARAAQETGIAMGVGSQRAALENPDHSAGFRLRKIAPDIPLYANLGAVQLNYGFGVDHCRAAVEMLEADALILHLNPLQEALQPEGETDFSGLEPKIDTVCRALPVPVIVKEVGWGISARTARRLLDCGVAAIDVAGAGGTSWSQVEMHRTSDDDRALSASLFRGWGLSTVAAVREVYEACPDTPLIASGGLRHGLDLARVLALGASLGGFAGVMLKAADASEDDALRLVQRITRELRISMFASGCSTLTALQSLNLKVVS